MPSSSALPRWAHPAVRRLDPMGAEGWTQPPTPGVFAPGAIPGADGRQPAQYREASRVGMPPLADAAKVSPEEARELCAIMLQVSGVAIDAGKRSFLELRVRRRLRATGHSDFRSYLRHLRSPEGASERQELAEALVTHTTSFFREPSHFDWLAAEALPQLIARGAGGGTPLTLWSAACSSGAEMWSAAMVLDDYATRSGQPLSWSVIGSDISRRILRRAAAATFTEEEVQSLPQRYLHRYLMRSRASADDSPTGRWLYKIVPELRDRAKLVWANLVMLERSPQLVADIAFLRNVLIYFPAADQRRIASAVAARLRPGGYLVTGHSEPLARDLPGLRQIAPSIHIRD